MRKVIAVIALLLLFAVPVAFAQTLEADGETAAGVSVKKPIVKPVSAIFLNGAGIAISSENPMDFLHAKAIVGGVRVLKDRECLKNAETTEEKEACISVERRGILSLDETKYRLEKAEITHDTLTAEIFNAKHSENPAAETVAIGTLSVKRVEKPGKDIWAGTIVLNGKTYNAYFLGVKREFTKEEAKDKMGDFCRRHPRERACRHLNLCKNNPDNPNCTEIKERLCTNNAGDIRCRGLLKKLCAEKPESVFCKKVTIKGRQETTIDATKVKIEETSEAEKSDGKEKIETETRTKTDGAETRTEVKVKIGGGE